MKTRQEILNERAIVLAQSKYKTHSGMGSIIIGIGRWYLILFGLSLLISIFNWSIFLPLIILDIFLALILGFLDTELVDRNQIVAVTNRWTRKAVCNFSEGRHSTCCFFYKTSTPMKTTPIIIKIPIRNMAVDRDDEDGTADAPVSADADLEVSLVLVDALSYQDWGGKEGLLQIANEALDSANAYMRPKALSTLESEKDDEIYEYFSTDKRGGVTELVRTIRRAGFVMVKVDLNNVRPTKSYAQARESKAKAIQEAEGAKEKSDARKKRIDFAYKHFKKNGYSDREAMMHAENRIKNEDGMLTENKQTYSVEGLGDIIPSIKDFLGKVSVNN